MNTLDDSEASESCKFVESNKGLVEDAIDDTECAEKELQLGTGSELAPVILLPATPLAYSVSWSSSKLPSFLLDHNYANFSFTYGGGSSNSVKHAFATPSTLSSVSSTSNHPATANFFSNKKHRLYELMSFAWKRIKLNRPCFVTDVDSFTKDAIRRTIYRFAKEEGCVLNLKNLLAKLKQNAVFEGGRDSLRKILHKIGFRYRKTENNRRLLQEREDIKTKRIKYLRKISEHRKLGRNIYYTDETYINLSIHSQKEWVDETACGQNPPIGKGAMFIIINCGGAQG